MRTVIALCLVLLSIIHCVTAGCQASVQVIKRSGSWEEGNVRRHIYDLQLTNTGSCTIRDSVTVNIHKPPGSFIGASWGINGGKVTGFNELAPGQTYEGVGFILAGHGTPAATVEGFRDCSCPDEPTPPPPPPVPEQPEPEPTECPPEPTEKPAPPAPTPKPWDGTYYNLGLKFLVLTCSLSDIRLNVSKLILDSVGSQYDVVIASTLGATGTLSLTNSDGSGKYYGIVADTDISSSSSCWSAAQQAQIDNYQITYSVKMVVMYTYPYPTSGVTLHSEVKSINTSNAYLTFADAMIPCVPSYNHNRRIPVNGVYSYPSNITNSSIATTAVYLTLEGETHTIAAFVNTGGKSRLEFYVDQASWALFPLMLGAGWLNWLSNGVFAGARRIEFNAHMDDIFMATGMFDLAKGTEGTKEIYRITPYDMQFTADWQIAANARLPAGTNITLTFPFNGVTVQESGGFKGDPLFLKGKELRDHFIWESHTYTHPELDTFTYNQVYNEFFNNLNTSKALFGDNLVGINNYCSSSVITPSISGLFNANAIRAMLALGITAVVGDNSRPNLCPQDSLYHGLHSTVKDNGYAGLYIVPRHATNIYYDASLPINIEEQFNYRYQAQFGKLTYEDILAREVDTTVKLLLQFRHDPFMFHQANMRTFMYKGVNTTLVTDWHDRIVDTLATYIQLPIISRKHDDLAQVFLDRETRDACGFVGTLKIQHGSNVVVGMNAKSTGKCVYGISGAKASGSNVQKYETYGAETTTWFNMNAGSNFDVTFDNPIMPL